MTDTQTVHSGTGTPHAAVRNVTTSAGASPNEALSEGKNFSQFSESSLSSKFIHEGPFLYLAPYEVFHPMMGPFYPREPPPLGRGLGVICAGSAILRTK